MATTQWTDAGRLGDDIPDDDPRAATYGDPFAGAQEPIDDYDAAVYVISIAAELAGMHPQTLRTYERKGLIDPARTEGNTRRYSRRDIDRLRFIQTLTQDEGLNLAGVRVVLQMGEQLQRSRQRVRDLEDMVRTLASRLQDTTSGGDRRFEIVPAPPRDVEVHPRFHRTGSGRPRPPGTTRRA
jgi:MerR family transcriptional regulator, heat shock protein HspR